MTEFKDSSRGPISSPAAKETHKPSASNDPLHGVTLEQMILRMEKRFGWTEMAERIPIRCFQIDPSVKSSLVFLRKTPWARKKFEDWFAYNARRWVMKSTADKEAD